MNSPVARLLNSRSQATSPYQSGGFVTVSAAYPAPLRCALASVAISVPHQEEDKEKHDDAGQAAQEGAQVIAPHVQPQVERLLGQPVHRGVIDEKVERVQHGVRLGVVVAVQVGPRHAGAVKLLDTLACAFAQLIDRSELDGLRWTRLGASRDEAVLLA